MTVAFEPAYNAPLVDEPLTHARILHADNRFRSKTIVASSVASGYYAEAPDNALTYEKWAPFTNELTSPTDFSTGWTISNGSLGSDNQTFTENTATGVHGFRQFLSIASGDKVFAARVKRQTRSIIRLTVSDGATNYFADFDLGNLTVTQSGNANADLKYLGNDEVLCRIQFLPSTGSGRVDVVGVSGTTNNYAGNGSTLKLLEAVLHDSVATWDIETHGFNEGDVFCVAGHNLGTGMGRLQFYHGSPFTNIGAVVSPPDDSPLMFIFEPRVASNWRLRVDRAVLPEISVIRVGKALQMPRPIFGGHSPISTSRVSTFRGNETETGEFAGLSRIRSRLQTSFTWQNIDNNWIESNWPEFQKAIEKEAFFVGWRPNAYHDVGYVRSVGSANPNNMGTRNLMQVTLNVKGLADD